MASLDQQSSSIQPTKAVEFGTRHSAFQPVRPRISKESTPWLPTGARRGGQPLMGPPPVSPVLAPLTPPARARSEERSSESDESSLGSPSSSNHSPRLPQLSWGQQRDEYLALSIGLGAVEI